jgi:hypothetical protein
MAHIYGRILGDLPWQVRHRIYGDDLVVETDHLRPAPGALPQGQLETAREFFQVIVSPVGEGLRIWGRRIVTRGSNRPDAICERIALDYALSRRDARGVREASDLVRRAVTTPDSVLPRPGYRFPKSGAPHRMQDIEASRPATK